jgi:ribosomal protein S18 acetylase RimI-like enzyme
VKARPYCSRDRDQVIALWFACDLVVLWNNPATDIDRKCEVNPELFMIAEVGGEIVATVMAGYEGHCGWINYLAVSPSHRRQGLGKRMIEEAETRLRAVGCPKVNLQVRRSNHEACRFYEAIGYLEDEAVSFGKRLIEDDSFEAPPN